MIVAVDIPDDLNASLVPDGQDAAHSILEDSVAEAYREGRLTTEQVRCLLGFGTRMEVDSFLGTRKIYDFTVEDLNSDLQALEALNIRHRELARP